LYLFNVTTWGVAPNGNALLIEKLENQTLLDIMHLPLNLHVETMEENKETGEITIYHQWFHLPMTDDFDMDEFVRIITLPAKERKDHILKPLYKLGEDDELNPMKHTRIADRPCPKCKKRGVISHSRRPCRLTQYLETCNTCTYRIGDTPYPIWEVIYPMYTIMWKLALSNDTKDAPKMPEEGEFIGEWGDLPNDKWITYQGNRNCLNTPRDETTIVNQYNDQPSKHDGFLWADCRTCWFHPNGWTFLRIQKNLSHLFRIDRN